MSSEDLSHLPHLPDAPPQLPQISQLELELSTADRILPSLADPDWDPYVEPTLLGHVIANRAVIVSRIFIAIWSIAIVVAGVLVRGRARDGASGGEPIDALGWIGLAVIAVAIVVGWWWSDRLTQNVHRLDGRLPSRLRCVSAWSWPAIWSLLMAVTVLQIQPGELLDVRFFIVGPIFAMAMWRPYALVRRLIASLSRLRSDALVSTGYVLDLAGFGLLWWQLWTWPSEGDVLSVGTVDALIGLTAAAAIAFAANQVIWALLLRDVDRAEIHRSIALRTRHDHRQLRLRGIDPMDPEVRWALLRIRQEEAERAEAAAALAEQEAEQVDEAAAALAEQEEAERAEAAAALAEQDSEQVDEADLLDELADHRFDEELEPAEPLDADLEEVDEIDELDELDELDEVEEVEELAESGPDAETSGLIESIRAAVSELAASDAASHADDTSSVAELDQLQEAGHEAPVVEEAEPGETEPEPEEIDVDETPPDEDAADAEPEIAARRDPEELADRLRGRLQEAGPVLPARTTDDAPHDEQPEDRVARIASRFDADDVPDAAPRAPQLTPDVAARDDDVPDPAERLGRLADRLEATGEPERQRSLLSRLEEYGIAATPIGTEGSAPIIETYLDTEPWIPPRLFLMEFARYILLTGIAAAAAGSAWMLTRTVDAGDRVELGLIQPGDIGFIDVARRTTVAMIAIMLTLVPFWSAVVALHAKRAGAEDTRASSCFTLFGVSAVATIVGFIVDGGTRGGVSLALTAVSLAAAIASAVLAAQVLQWFDRRTVSLAIWMTGLTFVFLSSWLGRMQQPIAPETALEAMTFFAALQAIVAGVALVVAAVGTADIEEAIRLRPELAEQRERLEPSE